SLPAECTNSVVAGCVQASFAQRAMLSSVEARMSYAPKSSGKPVHDQRPLASGSAGSVLEWENEGDHVVVRRAARYSSVDIHDAVFQKPPSAKSSEDLK